MTTDEHLFAFAIAALICGSCRKLAKQVAFGD